MRYIGPLLMVIFGMAWSAPFSWAVSVHAVCVDGTPAYGPEFTHFAYVNPDAPKGGTLKSHSIGTFDSFNPLLLKGKAADGISLVYDSLLTESEDETGTAYGLLAKEIRYPEDISFVEFVIHEKARFHNGEPVTASDVVFSWKMLLSHFGSGMRRYCSVVATVLAVDEKTVRFSFTEKNNPALILQVGQLLVLPEAYWKERDFDRADLTLPMGSGPYRVGDVVAGKRVTYERVKGYWGADLPVNRGRWNFDRIQCVYYRDDTVALEAFKAGLYDYRFETSAKNWAARYDGPRLSDGRIRKLSVPHAEPRGMQGIVMNIRRPALQNRMVRRALSLAFDYEWANQKLFYGQYTRVESYFENTDLKAPLLPGTREKEILTRWQEQLPEDLFTTAWQVPTTDGSGHCRENLIAADQLLEKSGWIMEKGQRVHRQTGRVFRFQFLTDSRKDERMLLPFQRNLARLGITMEIHLVDPPQFIKRIRACDFDMIVAGFPANNRPGRELVISFHSSGADRKDHRNFIGLKDPVVDALIEKILHTKQRKKMVPYARALDRVLLRGDYVIPFGTTTLRRLALSDQILRPAHPPGYGKAVSTWWHRPG